MRLRGWIGLGALVMGAVACGESVGPPAVQGGDLEFTAPAVKEATSESRMRTWDEPATPEELARANAVNEGTLADGEEVLPAIFSQYVLGEWDGNRFRMQYGMFGFGTAYDMSASVRFTDVNGTSRVVHADGRKEEAPIYWYMRPHAEQWFTVDAFCGTDATMNAQFTAYSRVPLLGTELSKAYQTASGISAQARCQIPSTPPTGGTTYTSNGFRVFLCFYELWTDLDGDVIGIFFFGCTEVSSGYYAA